MNRNKIIDDIKDDVSWFRRFGYFFLVIGVGFILAALSCYFKEKTNYMIFYCIMAGFLSVVSIALLTTAHEKNKMIKKILKSLE
jgi:hypothetical protein